MSTRGGFDADTDAVRHHSAARGLDRWSHPGTNHQQPDSDADRETRACGRDQGPRAPSRHARDSSRRSGRVSRGLGAYQLRARSSRRPPLRQRFPRLSLPDRRRSANRACTRTSRAAFPHAVYNRLESGFIGFVFHPEFARNGLFYTVHGERAAGNPEDARLHPARLRAERRDLPQRHHGVARHEPCGRRLRRNAARTAS